MATAHWPIQSGTVALSPSFGNVLERNVQTKRRVTYVLIAISIGVTRDTSYNVLERIVGQRNPAPPNQPFHISDTNQDAVRTTITPSLPP